jgi:hypothetical protein
MFMMWHGGNQNVTHLANRAATSGLDPFETFSRYAENSIPCPDLARIVISKTCWQKLCEAVSSRLRK